MPREPDRPPSSASLRSRLRHQQRLALLFTALLVLTVVAGLFLFIALTAAWPDLDAMRAAREARSWPTTPGEIVEAQLEHTHVDRPWRTGFFSDSERDLGHDRYLPRLQYRYEVADSTYTNVRISYHPRRAWSRAEAQRLVDGFPAGTTVDVHVEPGHPTHASLELPLDRSSRWKVPVLTLLALVAFALGARRAYGRWRSVAAG